MTLMARDLALCFPDGFLWGAATAAHQVEGGNRWNDWWEAEREGRVPHASGEACRHWDLYELDFDMARSWGHNAHRFSIEWSRIEPQRGTWNLQAIEHYVDVIRALRERGLEPVVTLHHFTNPTWFTHSGGWLWGEAPALFARYVKRVRDAFEGSVRYWITVNEPTVYVKQGFITGDWPPNLRGAWAKARRVIQGMLRAHVAAYRVLHTSDRPLVGIAHSAPWIVPCDPKRPGDRLAAWLRDGLLNRWLFHLIGARSLDFLGINYYYRTVVRRGRAGAAALLGEKCLEVHHADRGRFSDTGWEIYPTGLEAVLKKFSRLGVPLMVTENGVATQDEALRMAFLREHLAALGRAVQGGLPVMGYLYWTLMDNFEWTLGTQARFGLAAVDFRTQRRTPRPTADAFAVVCRTNRLALPENASVDGPAAIEKIH